MPSVPFDLGKYVTLRRRKDGTYRVLMEVPARLRPSGWSAAIPLPIEGSRTGDLTNADELGRIRSDAAALYVTLLRNRSGAAAPAASRRDFASLNRSWQQTQFFKDKSPTTQKGYAYHAGLVRDWAEAAGNRPVSGITYDAIEKFLALYDDRPTTRRHVKIVLKMLLDQAMRLEWRADNPAAHIKVKAPKARLTLWEADDVAAGAKACEAAGQRSLAALLLTEWEIGQRLTDVRLFRWGGEYKPEEGAFKFWQSKTGSWVTVEISEALQRTLEAARHPDSLYLFVDSKTGKPFAEQRLGHVWQAIRDGAGMDARLQVRTLRHSCVVQLARAGSTVPEIASVTGHSPFSAEQILGKYLPRDSQIAGNAQRKRGLIGSKGGQESDGGAQSGSDGRQKSGA